jgi:hypothetical protein
MQEGEFSAITIPARNIDMLMLEIHKARRRFGLPEEAPVISYSCRLRIPNCPLSRGQLAGACISPQVRSWITGLLIWYNPV